MSAVARTVERPARTTPRATSRATPRSTPRGASQPIRLVPAAAEDPDVSRSWLRRGPAPFVLLLVGLILATALGLLAMNTLINVDSLQASRLRAANTERTEQAAQLQEQVTDESTSAALAAAAAALGMVPAGTAGHLVLDPDGGSAVIGTAVPAEAPAAPAPTGG